MGLERLLAIVEGSVPNTHMVAITIPNFSAKGSDALF